MHVLYGSEPSFYTRKAWAALHLLGHPTDDRPKSLAVKAEVEAAVHGYHRFPVVQRPNGAWLTDSTDIALTLSAEAPGDPLLPADPTLRALALMLEDWIDEWFIRPVILHRVTHAPSRAFAARRGGHSLLGLRPHEHPTEAQAATLDRLQPRLEAFFTQVGDTHAVTPATAPRVLDTLETTCATLDSALAASPYLLGYRPTLPDVALWGMLAAGLLWEPHAASLITERHPALVAFHQRLPRADMTAPLDAPEAATARLAPLLAGDAHGFVPFLHANRAALDGGPAPSIDSVEVPPRGFTEKSRRRVGAALRELGTPATLPWPIVHAYAEVS